MYDYTNTPWKSQCIVRNMMNPNRGNENDTSYECFPMDNVYPATANSTLKVGPVTNNGFVNKQYPVSPNALFSDQPDGLLGDEDNGATSSWYLFSAMGISPVPGTEDLLIGSPVFSNITINI